MNRIISGEFDCFARRRRFKELLAEMRKHYEKELKAASFFGRLRLEWKIERAARSVLAQESPLHRL